MYTHLDKVVVDADVDHISCNEAGDVHVFSVLVDVPTKKMNTSELFGFMKTTMYMEDVERNLLLVKLPLELGNIMKQLEF